MHIQDQVLLELSIKGKLFAFSRMRAVTEGNLSKKEMLHSLTIYFDKMQSTLNEPGEISSE